MFDRSATRPRTRLGHRTLVIALATGLAAVSMFFASALDVGAMLRPAEAAARATASAPVELPHEWVWRGREPISLEYMYRNNEPPQQDWIRANRGH